MAKLEDGGEIGAGAVARDPSMARPQYKSKRCANCERGDWPGMSRTNTAWPDTVRCKLDDGLKKINYVCDAHVRLK